MPFGVVHGDAVVEIRDGAEFATYQIRVDTEADAKETGHAIGAVAYYLVNHSGASLASYSADDRAHYLIQEFAEAASPSEGQVVTGRSLTVVDGAIVCTAVYGPAPAEPVPQEVTRVQGRLQLLAEGRLDAVTAAVAEGSPEAQEYWASTAIFRRDNAMLTGMWAVLGWSEDALDDIFRAAAQIPT